MAVDTTGYSAQCQETRSPGSRGGKPSMRLFTTCLIVLSIAAPVAGEDVLTSPYREQTSTEIGGARRRRSRRCAKGRGMGLVKKIKAIPSWGRGNSVLE